MIFVYFLNILKMKHFLITSFLVALSLFANAQIVLFGVDITQNKPSEFVSVKKINCSPNPYFVFAEYSYQTIKFENYTAKMKTPQMKEPEKYTKELYLKLSKTLGKPFSILNRNDSTSLSEDKIVWRFQDNGVYYLIQLYKGSFGHFLIVQISNSNEGIISQVKFMESGINGYWNEEELLKFPVYVKP